MIGPITPARYAGLLTLDAMQHDARVSSQPAALVFADISGYTRLTERLAVLGRHGAEIVTDTVNSCFSLLIEQALTQGGDILRFGGDALFIAFTGGDCVARAAIAAARRQQAIATLASITVPGGKVRLRQSIGLHYGDLHLYRWQGSWSEVIPLGETVSAALRCEGAANPGQVLISPAAAQLIDPKYLVRNVNGYSALRFGSALARTLADTPQRSAGPTGDHESGMGGLSPAVARAIRDGSTPEHRAACIGFVSVHGTDHLANDADAIHALLHPILNEVDACSRELGIAPLATDVSVDGFKIILATGVATSSEDDDERLAAAMNRIVASAPPEFISGGAHCGVVFAGDVGHPARRSYTVMGDVVNLSARLMASAAPGTVAVSQALGQSLATTFATVAREPRFMKGKALPVQSSTLGQRRPVDAAEVAWDGALHGRTAELAQLRGAIISGGVIDLAGPAGIGKSRLIHAAAMAAHRPMQRIAISVDDSHRPFSLLDKISAHVGYAHVHDGPAEIRAASLGRALANAVGVNGVVLIEQFHHIDTGSRRVLAYLIGPLSEHGVSVVIERRGGVEPKLALGTHLTNLTLAGLDDQRIREIAIDVSWRALSDAELTIVVAHAGGNPSVARQLAVLAVINDELPRNLDALIAAELDALALSTRRVVRLASVIGVTVERPLLAALCQISVAELDVVLQPARQMLRRTRDGYTFRDDGVRSGVHSAISVRSRRQLHAQVATLLQQQATTHPDAAVLLAEHWWQADSMENSWVWSPPAAQAMTIRGAAVEAVRWYQRCLVAGARLNQPPRDMTPLAIALVEAARNGGLIDEELAAIDRVVEMAATDLSRAQALCRRADVLDRMGRTQAAVRCIGRGQRLLANGPAAQTGALASELLVQLASVRYWSGNTTAALRIVQRVLAQRPLAPHVEATAMYLNAWIEFATGGEQALEQALRANEIFAELGDRRQQCAALTLAGFAEEARGDWLAAQRYHAEAIPHAVAYGDVLNMATCQLNSAALLCELGELDTAERLADQSVRIHAAARNPKISAWTSTLHRVVGRAGRPAQACVALEDDIAQLESNGDPESALFRRAWLCEMLLLDGQCDRALLLAHDLVQRADALSTDHEVGLIARRHAAVATMLVGHESVGTDLLRGCIAAAQHRSAIPEICFTLQAARQLGVQLSPAEMATLARLEEQLGIVSIPWLHQHRHQQHQHG